MDNRTLGIIGGVALFLAILSPLFLENSKKVEKLYKEAETFRQNSEYMNAVGKYTAAFKESKKIGKTSITIDSEFRTLPIPILTNYKIALCYYEHGKVLDDSVQYSKARTYIDEIIDITSDKKLRWNLKYLQAMILYRIGKYGIAEPKLIELEKYYRKYNPDAHWIPEVVFTIGDIYLQQAEQFPDEEKGKMCDEAKNYFQKIVDNFPNSAYFIQAEKGINKIKEICLEKVPPNLTPDPDEIEAEKILKQADSFRIKREFNKAMEHYKKLIELYPNSRFITYAYEGKGDIYSEEGNDIPALANYEEAIYTNEDVERKDILYNKYHSVFPIPDPIPPPEPDPLIKKYNEAIQLRAQKKYIEAAKIFEEILQVSEDSDTLSHYFRLTCDCYYRAYKSGIMPTKNLISNLKRMENEYSDEWFSIYATDFTLRIYIIEQKNDDVIKLCSKTLEFYKNFDNVVVKEILIKMREFIDRDSIAIVPNPEPQPIPIPDVERLVEEAANLFNVNKLDQAYIKVNKALLRNKDYKPTLDLKNSILNRYLKIGIDYYKNKDYHNAIDQFQTILRHDRTFEKAHYNLGITYIRMDRFKDAIKTFDDAINLNQEFKEAHNYLGFANYRLKKYTRASQAVEKALEIDPNYDAAIVLKRAIEKQSVKSD